MREPWLSLRPYLPPVARAPGHGFLVPGVLSSALNSGPSQRGPGPSLSHGLFPLLPPTPRGCWEPTSAPCTCPWLTPQLRPPVMRTALP